MPRGGSYPAGDLMLWGISYPRDFDAPAGLPSASSLVFWLGHDRVSRAFYCIFIEGSILNMKEWRFKPAANNKHQEDAGG